MSTRDRFRKFRSDVRSWISQPPEPEAAPTSPPTQNPKSNPPWTAAQSHVPVTSASSGSTSDNWAYLRLFGKVLKSGTGLFGPLQEVVGGLIECIETFEMVSNERKEYAMLRDELNMLFKQLQEHYIGPIPPVMTGTIECLCRSIQHELAHVREMQTRSKSRQYLEAGNDIDEVLACYRRIQNLFQRVAFNVNVSIWRTVDEIATDNRLNRLSPSLSACYNSAQAIGLKRGPCATGTRIQLLGQMAGWVESSSPGATYWMSGMAGTGKTTIVYSLCQNLDSSCRLAATFFCSRLLPECRDTSLIIPTIAYQLARSSYPFRSVLSNMLEKDPDVHTRLPYLQFEALISRPLLQVKDTLPDNLVVVIDALDECEDKEGTSQILAVLLTKSSTLPIRFIVSSRPEPEIRDEMVNQSDQSGSRIVLHELDQYTVQADIETYLRASLAQIEPTEEQIATLAERAGNLFIYAATAVRYIGYDKFRRNPRARLANILRVSNAKDNKYKEIDELYSTILHMALDNPDLDDSERDDVRELLHAVICVQEPLTVAMISNLLKVNDVDRVRAALRPLWSVLHVSGGNELVTTLHASFPDYMLDSSRSKQYSCNPLVQNQRLALRCFDCFRLVRPQFNICNLKSSYLSDDQIDDLETRVWQAIAPELFYSARYWAIHLKLATGSPALIIELEQFLSKRLLLWMEVMNLKKCPENMPEAIQLLEKLNMELPAELRAYISDAWRITKMFALGAISRSTPHIYTSVLLFWPKSSPIAKSYTGRMQGMIGLDGTAFHQQQRALVATWNFDTIPKSAKFSPDGTQIALGLDNSVLLLSSTTGKQIIPPLEGHTEWVQSIQFSPDGSRLVSGSSDTTIRIWSTQSGKLVLGPLEGHTSVVCLVAFSLDGTRLVSGAWGTSTRIWDAHSGECLFECTEQLNPDDEIISFYATGGDHFVSASSSGEIVVWNTKDGQSFKTHCGSDTLAPWTSAAVSPDGTYIAAGDAKASIHIWNLRNGQVFLGPLRTTAGHHAYTRIESISFSSDGSLLSSVSEDVNIYVWDARNGTLVFGPLEGHSAHVYSVKFSPDRDYIISGALDRTLCLWDIRSTTINPVPLQGPASAVTSVGYLFDGTQIITTSTDHTACIWDAENGETIFGPLENIHCVAVSPDGTRIVCGSSTGLMMLDPRTGKLAVGSVQRKSANRVQSLEFSPDGSHILTTLSDESIWLFAADTGQTLMVIHPPASLEGRITSAVLSPNGLRIAVGWNMAALCMYETCSGRLTYGPLDGLNASSHTVKFSPDGSRVIAGSRGPLNMRDTQSGDIVLGPLDGHISLRSSVEFSRDGSCVVSSGWDNAVCVWDVATSKRVLGPVKWHTGSVNMASFSPDGTQIVTGSDDKTVRVTDIKKLPQQLPDSLVPTGRDWELNADGWIVDDCGQLLVWVPPELRTSLMWPRTKLLISRRGWLRLDFSHALLGNSWAECYLPD